MGTPTRLSESRSCRQIADDLYFIASEDHLRAEKKLILEAARALSAPSERKDMVLVPRSLAERTEAMFTSVDPFGGISKEWGEVMLSHHRQGKAV